MSGLEALGLACNIFQVISFAAETVSACKAIYDGEPIQSSILLEKAETMRTVATQIHQACEAMDTIEEKKLAETAIKCQSVAQQLEQKVRAIIKDQKKGSVGKALLAHTKYVWHKAKVQALEHSLHEYRVLMETQQLSSIWQVDLLWPQLCWLRLTDIYNSTRAQATQLRQRQDFDALTTNLQHFITQIAEGHTRMSDLIREEHFSTREAVKTEHRHTREIVALESQTVQTLVATEFQGSRTKAASEQQHHRLLRSFKFPEMHQRYHQVQKAHDATFQRIFRSYKVTARKFSENRVASEHVVGDKDTGAGDAESVSRSNKLIDVEHGARTDSEQAELKVESTGSEPGEDSDGSSATSRYFSSYDTTDIDHVWYSFVEWLQSDNNVYWIQGKPGSGKSTLVKFLVEHRATLSLLDRWSQLHKNGAITTVLSYFFWKIGTESQNTIRGLLCSLIHQYLSEDSTMTGHILNQFKTAALNDSPHDWSLGNLMDILLMILGRSTRALCIFIDGLDEICDNDGPEPLLDIVDQLVHQPKIKVCVSSRPGKAFERRLKHFAGLQLHQLTGPDMRQYVREELDGVRQYISDELRMQLVSDLVYRADGVFLWLHLVTRSIKKGIMEGETKEELFKRLEMPRGDLNKLFEDMWARLQDDEFLYRSTAAEYFWLVIKNKDVPKIWMSTKQHTHPRGMTSDGLWLFEILAIRNSTVQESLFWSRDVAVVSHDALEGYCKKIRYEIDIRCAGLLEFRPSTYLLAECSDIPDITSRLELYSQLTSEVSFIHRTAHDFLLGTETGSRILGADTKPPAETCKTRLKARLFMARAAYQHFGIQFDLRTFATDLVALAQADGLSNQIEPLPIFAEMIAHVRNAYEDEVVVGVYEPFRTFWRRLRGDHLLFLSWLSSYPEFDEFVVSVIKKANSTVLATRVLWEAWWIYGCARGAAPSRKLTEAIMAAGGDPHAPGSSPWMATYSLASSESDLPYLVQQRTAFSLLLEGAAWKWAELGQRPLMYHRSVAIDDRLPPQLLEVAKSMAATCPALQQTICLVGVYHGPILALVPPATCFIDPENGKHLIFFEVNLQQLLSLLRDWTQKTTGNDSAKPINTPTEDIGQRWRKVRFWRPAYKLEQEIYYLRILNPQKFDGLITRVFREDRDGIWKGRPLEPSLSQLVTSESEMERIESASISYVFAQELSDCSLINDVSEMDLDGIIQTSVSANQAFDLLCHSLGLNKA